MAATRHESEPELTTLKNGGRPENAIQSAQYPVEGLNHPAIGALANLFLALFIVVIGSSLGTFLGRELGRQGCFGAFNPAPQTEPDPAQIGPAEIGKLLAGTVGGLLVFPAQALLVYCLIRRPLTGCPARRLTAGKLAFPWVWVIGLGAIATTQALWFFLGMILSRWFGQEPSGHPLNRMLVHGGAVGLFLVALQGCLAAPVLEEVLCRGYLQSLLGRLGFAGSASVGGAVTVVLLGLGIQTDILRGTYGYFNAMLLALFLLLPWLALWLYSLRITKNQRPSTAQEMWPMGQNDALAAILAQAQIFCALHSTAWPAPIALLPLALGLGLIRAQGATLLVCVGVHASFNALSLVMALASLWAG